MAAGGSRAEAETGLSIGMIQAGQIVPRVALKIEWDGRGIVVVDVAGFEGHSFAGNFGALCLVAANGNWGGCAAQQA
jgi:hypothetical protein